MSLRSKRTSRPGVYTSTGFSSMSVGSYSIPKMSTSTNQAITAVTINRSLLAPLNIDVDPNIQVVRTQEKEEIKTLNNRFVSFIDKVRYLEQQNKMLETKWKMLEDKTPATSNIEPMMKAYIASLQKQLDFLNNDKHRLEMENEGMRKLVNDFKTKYEDETNKRNEAEQEFVMLKKDVDAGYLSKMELDDTVASINEEFQFLTSLYDAELRELQEKMKETNVVVQMDNSRALNMEQIVADVKAQYEIIATRSRTEAENWYKTKFDKMTAEADQYGNELRSTKSEIAELTRIIARRKNEIEVVKAQRATLESQITEAEARGDAAIKDANNRIRDLEQALQRSKQDMARQVREYQEVMNIKLALDIEISTYRKMLEGEEKRLGQDTVVNIQTVSPRTHSVRKLERRLSNPIVIKTMETNNVTYKNY